MYPKQALRRQKVPNRHSCMSAMDDLRTAAERGSQRERNVGAKILSERFAHLMSHHPSTERERTAQSHRYDAESSRRHIFLSFFRSFLCDGCGSDSGRSGPVVIGESGSAGCLSSSDNARLSVCCCSLCRVASNNNAVNGTATLQRDKNKITASNNSPKICKPLMDKVYSKVSPTLSP